MPEAALALLVLVGGLISAGPDGAQAAEVILYDRIGFAGEAIRLTDSAPDLDDYDFDNEVESIRVISGTWSFHRDDDFQNGNGPQIDLGPGGYPDIEALGFPGDRMSSVRLVADAIAPPIFCASPYQRPSADGQACEFDCAAGTVPDAATQECVCAQGFTETGVDGNRRVCGPYTLAPLPQEAHFIELDGLAVDYGAPQTQNTQVVLSLGTSRSQSLRFAQIMYRAAEGPQVGSVAARLQILAGAPWNPVHPGSPPLGSARLSGGAGEKYIHVQVRAGVPDAAGNLAWIESKPVTASILFSPPQGTASHQTQRVPVGQAFGVANERSYQFWSSDQNSPSLRCGMVRNGDILVFHVENTQRLVGSPTPGVETRCDFRLFGGRALAAGWSFDGRLDLEPGQCATGDISFADRSGTGDPHLLISIVVDFEGVSALLSECVLHDWTVRTIGLRGPAGADWRSAFR